ncbi:MAG: ribosome biogenesis factor YjgA [Oleiphilaceae bacterium]|nr:ribosome biogenesis factor YjgA [Oleiphilaceae bacterium]
MMSEDYYDDDESEIKSKSQIKREMAALQEMGKQLCELKTSQLNEVPISASLREAIDLYNRVHQKEARRRQMQFIGKLMRNEDAEAIQDVLDRFDTSSRAHAQALHQVEAWREKLINGDNEDITAFVDEHPGVDIQQLRQWVRKAKKDNETGKNTGAAKKLFQFIREYEN